MDISATIPPLSCRLEVLPGRRLIDKLRSAATFGFEAVSLPGRTLHEYLEPLRACRQDVQIRLAGLSLGFEGTLVSPDQRVRQRCRESILRLFDLCHELSIPTLNMPPVLVMDNPIRIRDAGAYGSPEAHQDRLLIGQLRQLADRAAAAGVQLLLEPVNRYESEYLNTLAHAARICKAVGHPQIGITADFFHMQMEELDVFQAIRHASRYIGLVHVAENTRVEPGPGAMDFSSGFRALSECRYQGTVEVECRRLSGRAEEVLPRSLGYLRDLLCEAYAQSN